MLRYIIHFIIMVYIIIIEYNNLGLAKINGVLAKGGVEICMECGGFGVAPNRNAGGEFIC